MAWRIHEHVVRGEIDNRERGIVRGQIWLAGYSDPIVLELQGNASEDLAGCLLTFENPGKPKTAKPEDGIAALQRGTIGDLTASRKVRVFDIPVAEAYERLKKKLPVSEHLANCLYLEWFSELNGRVVIESTDYRLTISPPSWRLTPEDEAQRADEAAAGFDGFIQDVTAALEASNQPHKEDADWDEFDYEKLLRESEARSSKLEELFDKYLHHPDRDRIIAQEMGWTKSDKETNGGEESTVEPEIEINENLEEMPEPEPDPAREGIDWIRDERGEIVHPLYHRTQEAVVAFWNKLHDLGLDVTDDEDLQALRDEFQITGSKLAGALNDVATDCAPPEAAFVVAYLKRALSHLHAAQAAFPKVDAKKLLPAETLSALRTEIAGIREEIIRLMDEYRRKE